MATRGQKRKTPPPTYASDGVEDAQSAPAASSEPTAAAAVASEPAEEPEPQEPEPQEPEPPGPGPQDDDSSILGGVGRGGPHHLVDGQNLLARERGRTRISRVAPRGARLFPVRAEADGEGHGDGDGD